MYVYMNLKPIKYMRNPRIIEKLNNWTYSVPLYNITDEGVEDSTRMIISLCRGNKSDPSVPRQEGMFTETLLQICLEYLQGVNQGELANRDTSIAITHIEDALLRLNKRAEDRKLRGVQATYQK